MLSPYCSRESWWYNEFTPLPWNNYSRLHHYNYYYANIHPYYFYY